MRYHLTPVRIAVNKKSTNNKCWIGCGEKRTLLQYWWECKLIQPLWKTVWRFLKKLGINLSYDPAIPPLSSYPEKNRNSQTHMLLLFSCLVVSDSATPGAAAAQAYLSLTISRSFTKLMSIVSVSHLKAHCSNIYDSHGEGNYYSILAWEIPRTEECSGLQPMVLQRAGHD